MSQIDSTKKVYIIVHGQRDLVEPVKEKLTAAGFSKENMAMASLDKAGEAGEYVAMLWPPMAPKGITVSVITGPAQPGQNTGMGAWSSVNLQETLRLSLG